MNEENIYLAKQCVGTHTVQIWQYTNQNIISTCENCCYEMSLYDILYLWGLLNAFLYSRTHMTPKHMTCLNGFHLHPGFVCGISSARSVLGAKCAVFGCARQQVSSVMSAILGCV